MSNPGKRMAKRMAEAAARTWETIAQDVMDEQGHSLLGVDEPIDAETSLEVTLDSSHLETYGGDPEAVAQLRRELQLNREETESMLLAVFDQYF